jgi:gamma-glutamyltranspeptidase
VERDPVTLAGRLVSGVMLLVVLAAVATSTGLVVYTARAHDLGGGLFAIIFAVISVKAALSWLAWSDASPRPDAEDGGKAG